MNKTTGKRGNRIRRKLFRPCLDEGISTKRGRDTHRQPVFGIFEGNGKVYTEIVPDCKRETLRATILGKIHPQSVIYSDGWSGYDRLVDVGYDRHFRIKHHKNEFTKRSSVHINGIESFWSFTKRRLRKFNGILSQPSSQGKQMALE